MSQFTASEVRKIAKYYSSSTAHAVLRVLDAFADLLEAQERAEPEAWRSITPDGVEHEWNDDAPSAEDYESARLYGDKIELAFTHPPAASVTDAEDAARYRWLREGDNDDKVLERTGDDWDEVFLPRLERLDAAIDAARAKEPQS